MHAFAPLSDLEIFVKFCILQRGCQFFSQMLLFCRQIDDFSPQISRRITGISRNPNPEFNEFHFRTSLLSF